MTEKKSGKFDAGGSQKDAKKISTKGLDVIIKGILFLVFFLSPIFFTGYAAQGIGFEKMTLFYFLILLGTVAWVTKGVIAGDLKLKRTPLDVPFIIFLIVSVVSTILSVSNVDSLIGSYGQSAKGLSSIIIFILFYYFVINNTDKKTIKMLFWSVIGSSAVLGIYSFLQLLGIFVLPLGFTKQISFNPLGSIFGLTMYAVAILPILVIAVSQFNEITGGSKILGKKPVANLLRGLVGIITLLYLAILLLLNGFTFWPAALVSIVIVLMFFLSKIVTISNNDIIFPIGVFLAIVILFVLGNFNFYQLNLPAEVSLSKGASWDIAKSALKSNPLFGSGPSTFYYNFSKFKSSAFNNTPLWNIRFDSASGMFFESLATLGVLGTISMVVALLIMISLSFLSLIKTKSKDVHPILLALFASFISILIFSLLFALNNSVVITFVLISILTLAAAISVYPEEFKVINLSFRSSPKYALSLAAIFLSVSAGVVVLFTVGLKMYLGDIYARAAIVEQDNSKKIVDLNRAIQLSPYRDDYYINVANAYMALANQEALGSKDQTKIQQNLSLAIESGKKAVQANPNKARNNESLALIYENASFYTRGALEWSEKYYNTVIDLDPQNPAPLLRIALVNMARANAESDNDEKKFYIEEAIKKYDEALVKKENLASAHYGKAIAYEKLGNIDKAIENLSNASLLARDNIDYRFELGRMFFNRGVSNATIKQNATKQITENEIDGEGENDNLSIQADKTDSGKVVKNPDLSNAEQLFLSIVKNNNKHANAIYSLAVLYQKTGEINNAKLMVQSLLKILPEGQTKDAVKKQFQGSY